MGSFPSLEQVKSELAAVKKRVDDLGERIDHLRDQLRRDRKTLHQSPARKQAEVNNRIQSRDKDLKRRTNLLNQLHARKKSLDHRIEAGEQDDNELSIAHLSVPEQKQLLERLMKIGEDDS